jgi:hypothetical protein
MSFDLQTALELLAVPAEEILPILGVGSVAEITQIGKLALALASLVDTALKDKASANADTIQVAVAAAEIGADALEDGKFGVKP